MSKKENKKQNYKIETTTSIELVRAKFNEMFDESNNIFKGKFVGTIKNDIFSGHTSYNTNIDVKGKIFENKEKTIIDLNINDCRPNFKAIINTLFIVFLFLALLIIASSKVTDIIIYLIVIVLFGLGYLVMRIKRYIFKSFEPKLREIADDIAKDTNGKIINIE